MIKSTGCLEVNLSIYGNIFKIILDDPILLKYNYIIFPPSSPSCICQDCRALFILFHIERIKLELRTVDKETQ